MPYEKNSVILGQREWAAINISSNPLSTADLIATFGISSCFMIGIHDNSSNIALAAHVDLTEGTEELVEEIAPLLSEIIDPRITVGNLSNQIAASRPDEIFRRKNLVTRIAEESKRRSVSGNVFVKPVNNSAEYIMRPGRGLRPAVGVLETVMRHDPAAAIEILQNSQRLLQTQRARESRIPYTQTRRSALIDFKV